MRNCNRKEVHLDNKYLQYQIYKINYNLNYSNFMCNKEELRKRQVKNCFIDKFVQLNTKNVPVNTFV